MDTGPPPVSHRPLRPPGMCSPTSALLLTLRFGHGRGPDGTCGPGGRRHAVRAEAGAGRSGVLEGRLVGGAEGTIGATTSRSGTFLDEAVHSSHPDRRAIKGESSRGSEFSTRRNKRHRNNPSRPGQPAGVSGFSGLSSWHWSSTDTTSWSTAPCCPLCSRIPLSSASSTPELAGALGSYALVGVLIGALITGTLSDKSGDGRWS